MLRFAVLMTLLQIAPGLRIENAVAVTETNIPKIIHHTSKVPIAEMHEASYITVVSFNSWRKLFPSPEYRTIVSTDDDLANCVAEHFPEFTSQWNKLEGVEKADAGRYCMLFKYGGVYADLDYEVRTNFFDDIAGESVSLLEACYQETKKKESKVQVQNALMASPARHPFWQLAFKSMQLAGNKHAWNDAHGTGPRMLSILADHSSDVRLFPCANYQRVGKCGNFRELEFQKGIHWNQASWKKTTHSFNSDLVHEGFKNAHPDLGDVGVDNAGTSRFEHLHEFSMKGDQMHLKVDREFAESVGSASVSSNKAALTISADGTNPRI